MEAMEGIKLPALTNCCFYIPLREGFLAFTYFSLAYHILYLAAVFLITGMTVILGGSLNPSDLPWFAMLPLLFSLVVYNVLVIAATHMTSAKGITYSIILGAVLWMITIPYCVYLSYNTIKYAQSNWLFAVIILEPFLQGYGLLLIHSLKLKLRAEGKFDYINLDDENDHT